MVCDCWWQMSVSLLVTALSHLLVSKEDMLERWVLMPTAFAFVEQDNTIANVLSPATRGSPPHAGPHFFHF